MKLWGKDKKLDKAIEQFTVGNDYLLDQKLVKYDCLASIAHAKMINSMDVLTEEELTKLIKGLTEIILLHSENKFEIKQKDEDCHTAVENFLTEKYGEVGRKIHTARSRNDQVITALRLYEKEELAEIKKLVENFMETIESVINKNGKIIFPGYTHMQKAMPTDIKTWLGSCNDSMKDNIFMLNSVMNLIDQNPLGSAAGFGVPIFKLDKNITTKELNFPKVMDNPMHCQFSRGKFEAQIVNVLSMILFDLNKLASDLILFSMKEFGFIELPDEFCTGSSIMPQKKNPDVLELVRAKYHIVLGEEFKIKSLISNLISGYNRDTQLTKEPLMKSIEITKECLDIISLVLDSININEENCRNAMTKELYATQEAYELVKQGIPFRQAYEEIKTKYQE